MADKILHKRSGTPSAVPSAASLELGELALNTADGRAFMKKNDGAVVEIGSTASGYFRTEPITATATGQTSFTVPGGYTPGAIFVSLNGAALAPEDFAATNGTTVVLASAEGIVVGSVLLVYVLTAFQVADALPIGGTAADSSRLGGQLPSYYATQSDLAGVAPGPDYYQRNNILGTVSQSGGVPTGAIIERGSNANGEYIRWADGTQICVATKADPATAITTGFFGALRSTGKTWLYPAEFTQLDAVSAAPRTSVDGFTINAGGNVSSITYFYTAVASQAAADRQCYLFAIGRWY